MKGDCSIKHYGFVIYGKWADFIISFIISQTHKLGQTQRLSTEFVDYKSVFIVQSLAYYRIYTIQLRNVYIVQVPRCVTCRATKDRCCNHFCNKAPV
jgi:hypothetical protein